MTIEQADQGNVYWRRGY